MEDDWRAAAELIFQSSQFRRRRGRLFQLRDSFRDLVSFVDTLEDFELVSAEMDIELVESRASESGGCVTSLLDLASKSVAQNISCESLECHDPPLDEALLRKVAFWAFPQDELKIKAYAMVMGEAQWNHGISLVKDNKIREMWQVGFMLTAYIVKFSSSQPDGTSDIRVSMTFEKQRIITSSCSECQNQLWCAHIVAATVYRIRNAHKVPVHAPMTETLSTLDRNQLQKLLQYAVQEDPAGILGKVFKHLDEIRDVGSDISTLHGAPDPTFGSLRETRTQWHLSMDWLEKTLGQDLQDMCNHRLWSFHSSENNSFYPTTYDSAKKRKSKMYPYIGLAVELARQDELDSAADVIIKICEVVVAKMQSAGSKMECPHFARFVRDLAQYYTLLLLHPRLAPCVRTKLLDAAQVLHSNSCKLDFKVEDSLWAELPSVMHTKSFTLNRNKETETQWSPFEEPLVIKDVGGWSEDLLALIEGRSSVEESTYDEDVTIMLARMETLYHFESGDSTSKIARLCSKIVRKLLPLIQEDTILGAYLAHHVDDDLDILGLLQKAAGLTVTSVPSANGATDDLIDSVKVKGKSRKRGSKGKRPAKRARRDKGGSARQLSQGQLAYSMLYVLRRLITANQLSNGHYENPSLLSGFCLLSLELSRHRVVAPRGTISELEHNWVTVTEYFIVQQLSAMLPLPDASTSSARRDLSGATDGAVSLYLNALRTVGCDFYMGTFPLIMLDALLTVFSRSEQMQQQHSGDVVEVCARVLNDVNGAMQRFTLPVSSWVDLCIDASLVEPKLKDLVLKKLHHVLQTFLAQINLSCREHIGLLLKVIQQFQAVDNAPLLHLTSRSLRQHFTKLQQSTPAVEAMVGVVLHTLEKAKVFYLGLDSEEAARRMEKEFLVTLINHLGLEGLRLLVGRWDGPLKCREIKELVVSFEPQIRALGTVPRDVIALLHEFFASRCQHDEDACDLLRFFVPRDENWYFAVRAILENARFYHPNTFFELARQEYQHTMSSPADALPGAVPGFATTGSFEIVLSFLEKGFECFQKGYDYCHPLTSNAKTMQYVDWMCNAFVVDGFGGGVIDATSTNTNIVRIVQLVNERARGSPDFILRMLQNMERSAIAARYAEPLRSGLVLAYKEHFDYKVYQSSHSAYASVINDMHRARLVCKQYVPNGEADFDAVVVDHVRTVHRSKKKLVKMLASEFGSGRPLGTESSV